MLRDPLKFFLFMSTFVLSCPAQAEFRFENTPADTVAYVESNLLGIFYHELGHALIDILGLPIFGQEEDAADVFSVFLIDALYEEESAVQLAYDTAFGFLGEAENTDDIAFWDVHGPDLQRYYNLICIFYGANPDERYDVAQDLGLPQDRADYCSVEYEQAVDSWGQALDKVTYSPGGKTFQLGSIVVDSDAGMLTEDLIRSEVDALNKGFRLPDQLRVSVVACGEANAFYDPGSREIVMCSEFADWLAETAP